MIKCQSNVKLIVNGISAEDIYLIASGNMNGIYLDYLVTEDGVWTTDGNGKFLVFSPDNFQNLSAQVYSLQDYSLITLKDVLELLRVEEDFYLDYDTCQINTWEHEKKLE